MGGSTMSENEINQRLAETILNAGRLNGRVFRPGDWMALLEGKVVAVAENLDGALIALRGLDPNPQRGMVFEMGTRASDVIR
jgi:hypothetical protein